MTATTKITAPDGVTTGTTTRGSRYLACRVADAGARFS